MARGNTKWLLPALAAAALAVGAPRVPAQQVDAEAMRAGAFEGAQWVLATGAARAVAQVGARAAAGDGPLGQLIRDRQRLEARLAALRRGQAGAATDEIAAIQAESARLTERLDALDAEIRADFPEYAEIANPRPLGFDALRPLLAPDEGLILFLTARGGTYVWAVSRAGTAWHRSRLGAQDLDDRVRALRADLDPTGPARAAAPLSAPATPSLPPFRADLAHELYAELLAPVLPALADVDHLFVVKDGALSSLPLAVLLTDPLEDDGDLARAPWLLRRFALTTLPAVSSLQSIRGGPAKAATGAYFTGFGNPAFDGPGPDSGPAGVQVASRSVGAFFDDTGTRLDAIRALPPLPGTARELHRIAGLFPPDGARLVLGPEATEAAVKTADLSQSAILSFATHGLITGDMSGLAEPALAFSPPETASALDDGLLTASEASALNLDADWVILSACNTAAGDGTPGAEGLSGLARAFLLAGARSILVSHWPVRDDVAATLTSETLRRLRDDPTLGRSQALRRAMLDLMTDDSDPTLAHPGSWAPFVVVGEGGALNAAAGQ